MNRPTDMARPEIPSIVVHNGSASISPVSPNSLEMQGPPGLARAMMAGHSGMGPNTNAPAHSSASSQNTLLSCDGDSSSSSSLVVGSCELPSSCHQSPTLPLTPPTCSPSPSHSLGCTSQLRDTAHSPISIPQGPGPGGGMPPTQANPHNTHCEMMPTSPSHGAGPPRSRSLELPHQRSSTDSEIDSPVSAQRHNRQHGAKLKLLQRSHAMREDTSPPPEIMEMGGGRRYPNMGPPPHMGLSNSLHVGGPGLGPAGIGGPLLPGVGRRRLRHQGSSGGSFEDPSPILSRDSSQEYTDSTGVDLFPFIVQTLHKNQKDRLLLLRIEKELVLLVNDKKRSHHRFPQMSSYQRMLVHRVAAFFGLEHNVDQIGTSVIVNKSRNTRLPSERFRDHCRDELLPPEEPLKRSILRRGFNSYEEDPYKCADRQHGIEARRCKSFEEREQEYEKVRQRIFSQESFSSMEGMIMESPRHFLSHEGHPHMTHDSRRSSRDDSHWHDSRKWMAEQEAHRVYQSYDSHRLRPSYPPPYPPQFNYRPEDRPMRLPKVSSFETCLHSKTLRPPVFKSHSFGGYSGGVTVLSRGDSVASNPPPSRLSKHDSLSSRLSEHSSSSGYKTQRQDTSSTNVSNTMSTTPSPTAGHAHPQHYSQQLGGVWGGEGETPPVVWAVTDMEAVPTGALIINPQTGQPYLNSDGSAYRFDPTNPPPNASGGSRSPKNSPQSHCMPSASYSRENKGGGSKDSTPDNLLSLSESGEQVGDSSPQTTRSASPHSPPPATTPDRITQLHQDTYVLEEDEKSEPVRQEDYSPTPSSIEERAAHQPPENSVSEMNKQMSSMAIAAATNDATIDATHASGDRRLEEEPSPPLAISSTIPTSVHHDTASYPGPPRQHYTHPVYYLPANTSSLAGGGLKYMYSPQSGSLGHPSGSLGHPSGSLGHPSGSLGHPSGHPPLAHHPHHASQPQSLDGQSSLNPGYLPPGYAVMAYPPNGMAPPSAPAVPPHESGGTTYYCLPSGAGGAGGSLPPHGGVNPITAAAAAAAGTPHQFGAMPPTSTAQPGYPVALNYYSGNGLNGGAGSMGPGSMGPVYPPQPYHPATGLYGTPPTHMGAVPTSAPIPYRAPTPPQTPSCTQPMNIPMGYSATPDPRGGVMPSGMGGQYITVLPPTQPGLSSTPHTQPHIYTTFYRPNVPVLSGGSTSTPPPTPILQYGGVPVPHPGHSAAHPPVFAKSFVGPQLHPFVALTGAEKEEGKRYLIPAGRTTPSAIPGSLPGGGTLPHTHHHFISHRPPYTFMQS